MVSATDPNGRMLGFLDRTSKKIQTQSLHRQRERSYYVIINERRATHGRITSGLKYRSIATFCTALKLASNALMGILLILTTQVEDHVRYKRGDEGYSSVILRLHLTVFS
jgi:hypothetical protein